MVDAILPPIEPDAAPPVDAATVVDVAVPDRPPPRDVEVVDAEVLPASCAEIKAREPSAPDGVYTLDPDGPGGAGPFSLYCDMTTQGGGWTRLVQDDFSGGATGFTKNVVTTCGGFGAILGGYKTFNREAVSTTVALRGVPHREVRVVFELVILDSWDHEWVYLDVDGQRVWSKQCEKGAPFTCNQRTDQCGWDGVDRLDGKVPADLVIPHDRASVTFTWSALLDQADEFWGLDNLAVYVR